MKSPHLFLIVFVMQLLLLTGPVDGKQNSDTSVRLQSAVHRMTFWLGAGENSQRWRQILKLNHLDTQSALGDRADVATLQMILDRFEMDVKGLDSPAFVDVRNGLKRQIKFLTRRSVVDFKTEIEEAEFVPIAESTLDELLRETIFEYKSLTNYYRGKMTSHDRAMLFYDIQPLEMVDFLSSLDMAEFLSELIIKTPGPDDGEDSETNEEKQAAEELETRKKEVVTRMRAAVTALEKKDFELNDPFVTSTRISIERLLSAFVYATNSRSEAYFDREIEKLRENIDGLADPTATAEHAIVGDSLGRLQSMVQVPNLISAIRARYSLPNMRINVSSRLINKLVAQDIVQAQPVNELVLGRLIRGHAISRGRVQMELIDDPNQAQLSIQLDAAITSNTHSSQYPITAFTETAGSVNARRNIFLNATGFYGNEPTGAACLSSQFNGIDSSSKLINKIAVKQYNRDKRRSEQVGEERALKQALDEFTEKTDPVVSQDSGEFKRLFEAVEPYAGLLPELYARTTSEQLLFSGHRASAFGLAAHTDPPASFANPDVGIKIHETLLTNYLTPYLAGKTFSNQQIADLMVEYTGSVPDGIAPETEQDEFSITFDTIQPIRLVFRDSRLGVAISGRRFRQGKKRIDAALVISLKFKIVREEGKLYLKRDGEAEVDYGTPERKNAKNAAFKNTLTQLLNGNDDVNELKEELPNNLIPEKDFEFDSKGIVKNFKLSQFSIADGWLQLGWNYQEAFDFQAMLTDTPAIQSEVIIKGTVDEYTPKESDDSDEEDDDSAANDEDDEDSKGSATIQPIEPITNG